MPHGSPNKEGRGASECRDTAHIIWGSDLNIKHLFRNNGTLPADMFKVILVIAKFNARLVARFNNIKLIAKLSSNTLAVCMYKARDDTEARNTFKIPSL